MNTDLSVHDWKGISGPIGLFGGTFDPIQRAHLQIAEAALDSGKVGSVVFIPAHQNPLKSGSPSASEEDRAAMIRLALSGNKRFYLSDIELKRDPSINSYTFDTVSEIRSVVPSTTQLLFIMGTDCLVSFERWHRVHELLSLLDGFIIYPRGIDDEVELNLESNFSTAEISKLLSSTLRAPELLVSSTEVRRRIKAGVEIASLVSPEVADFIAQNALYS